MEWDPDVYLMVIQMLLDGEQLAGRMRACATRPRVPHPTDLALTVAHSAQLEVCRLLHAEKARLESAKVASDARS
jgi:hypothetical protein